MKICTQHMKEVTFLAVFKLCDSESILREDKPFGCLQSMAEELNWGNREQIQRISG